MGVLTYNSRANLYVWQGGYEERHVPKQAGFRWCSGRCSSKYNCKACSSGLRKVWWTDDGSVAAKLGQYADDSAKAVFGGEPPAAASAPEPAPEPPRDTSKLIRNEEAGIYVWQGEYEEKHIPKEAGFRWCSGNCDPKYKCGACPAGLSKVWWTYKDDVAAKLANFANAELKHRLLSVGRRKQERLDASRAASADVELPKPEGLEYLPFQKAGVAYALDRHSTLIGDEMGLGKTIQAIGIMNADPSVEQVLVICPASLKINWKREVEKWSVRPVKVGIASGDYFPDSTHNVFVINYDILKRHESKMKGFQWDMLVVDECHLLKNPKVQRTKIVLGHYDREKKCRTVEPIDARRLVFMTGTPIVNRPVELHPIAARLAPQVFGNFWRYAQRYCDAQETKYGWDFTGASNLEELQEKLRLSIMVRRLKSEVMKELPPKVRQVIEMPANGCANAVAREVEWFNEYEDQMEELEANVELAKIGGTEEEYREAVRQLHEGIQVAFTEMSQVRHATALEKVPMVVEHLENAIESSGKVICFAHHRDVIAKILEAFPDAVSITGDTPMVKRDEAVAKFQNDPECKLFVGNIQAAGVGLTLNASSHVVFAELDWVPGNVSQAEDRAHRFGQKYSVLVQHLVLEGSLDARMANIIVVKQEVIDKALNDEIRMEIMEVPVTPIKRDRSEIQRDLLAEEAEKITVEQTEAIHEGLRVIAGMCDGAEQLDGMGFNKFDTKVGKRLAGSIVLEPMQAAYGRRLVRKYRRQLPSDLVTLAVEGTNGKAA